MIRDAEFSDEAIGKFIQEDGVGRNQYLGSFIKALNSVEASTYISLDASWGTGKTVFMRQLEYLSYRPLNNLQIPNIDTPSLQDFQNKYVVFYYNAWQNDHHNDPLQSLLFSVINGLYGDTKRKEKVKALAANAIKLIARGAIKSLTKDIVDVDKISSVSTIDDLVNGITAVNDRKQAISDIIHAILPSGKKLLLIIDELDRCNPEFAMRLMEVAKHYYDDDDMVFVLSTNNRQLVHTVKKYYGNDFDGYGYLSKMYDLTLELPPIDMDKYFRNILKVPNDSYYIHLVPAIIAKHLNMTMREANRYHSLLKFIEGKLTGGGQWGGSTTTALTHFVFVPLALAFKVKDIGQYDNFISGSGESLVRHLYASSDVLTHIKGQNTAKGDQSQSAVDAAVESYKAIINYNHTARTQDNYGLIQDAEFFINILPLISSIANIDTLSEESVD